MKNLLILTITTFLLTQANAQNWDQVRKAVPSDRAKDDYFGASVSISGDYAIVGAYGDKDAGGGILVGSAYLFEWDTSGNWNQVQRIVASDREFNDRFGSSVSISGDYAIVGAYSKDSEAGSAYIFERDGVGNWNQVKKIVASDRSAGDFFGISVSISGDYAIVGSPKDFDDASGGNPINSAGSAYLFKRDSGGVWNQVQKIVASDRGLNDRFAWSVSISGDYAMAGAYLEDENAAGTDSMSDAGSAYVFEKDSSGSWNQTQKIVALDRASEDQFAFALSICGNRAIVGAHYEDEDTSGLFYQSRAGSAYLFERDGVGNWNQVQKIVASDRGADDNFGYSVSISGNRVIVGAVAEDNNIAGVDSMHNAGSVYLFERDGIGNWSQLQKIVASDREPGDNFGQFVYISGNRVIVGAFTEDENTFGNDSLRNAGSIYLFEGPCAVDVSVLQSNGKLTVYACDAAYQWLDCNNSYAPISGETNQSFTTATINGSYAVQVTQYGCVDTSACYMVTGIEIIESDFGAALSVYPNPTTGKLMLDLGQAYNKVSVTISNLLGQIITAQQFGTTQQLSIDLGWLVAGFYLFEINVGEASATLKVIKD